MSNTFLTLIVSAEAVEQIRGLAAYWSGGEGMFTTALTSDGVTPSHYISSGYIYGGVVEHLPYSTYETVVDENESKTVVVTNHAGDINAIVAGVNEDNPEANLTVQDVEALLPFVDSSNQLPRDAMTRMGLEIWSDQSSQ